MKNYTEVLDYAEKIWLWNSTQYKKIEYALKNHDKLNENEKKRLKKTMDNLLVETIDDNKKVFKNKFWF